MKHLYLMILGLFFFPFKSYSQCQTVPSHAVAWWDADNVSGTIVSDIRGGMSGQLKNGGFIDSGIVCNSFNLDGTDDHIAIAHNDSLTFSDGTTDRAFSVETWINLRDVTTSMIFSKGDNLEREYSFRITGTVADHLAVGLYDDRRSAGGNYNVIGVRSAFDFKNDENSWVHVAFTYDGSGVSSGIKLYRNGGLIPTTVLVGTDSLGIYSAMRTTGKGATIGRFFTDGPQYLDGRVDELSVYSRVLSVTELNNIFLAGTDGKCITVIDNDTSGCHGDPFVFVESISSKNEVILKLNSNQKGLLDIIFHSNQAGVYSIYSMEGKELRNTNFNSTNRLAINFHSFNTGMYIIHILTDNGEFESIKFLNR